MTSAVNTETLDDHINMPVLFSHDHYARKCQFLLEARYHPGEKSETKVEDLEDIVFRRLESTATRVPFTPKYGRFEIWFLEV